MSHPIQVAPHLSIPELLSRYRSAQDPREKSRFQILWLIAEGHSSREVAHVTGYGQKWVREIVLRYNRGGPDAVLDGRRHNPGHPPLLSTDQLAELSTLLEQPTPEGEPWSGPRVARWMSERLGQQVAPQRGWEYLRKAGFTPQRPRPRHREADSEAQARFPAGTAARA